MHESRAVTGAPGSGSEALELGQNKGKTARTPQACQCGKVTPDHAIGL